MASFREVEYMEEPPRHRRRRRRRRRRWGRTVVTLLVIVLLGLAAYKLRGGFSGFGLPVRLSLENTDTQFVYELSELEARITDDMYVDECGAQEAEELRGLARSNPEWADELEFMARHIGIYTREAVVTAINGVEKTPFALLSAFRAPDASGLDVRIEVSEGEVPYLLQYDSRWCYHAYGSSVMGFTACGPTCLSMAAIGLTGNTDYTPAYVADRAEAGGHYVMDAGTAWSLFTVGSAEYGLRCETIVVNKDTMKDRLRAGAVLIAAMSPGDFTTSGHFIVIVDTGLGGFKVYDPNSIERSERSWSFRRLEGQIAQLWSLTYARGAQEAQGGGMQLAGESYIADCEEFITLRSAPDVNAAQITTIPRGGEMMLLGFEGAFAEVEYQGQRGYVLSTYIVPKSDSAVPTSAFGYTELEAGLQRLAEEYPGELELGSIGTSVEGRELYAAVVGCEGAQYEVLIQGGIHGREYIGAYLVYSQLEHVLEQGVPEDVRFHFIPMANPDGVEISRTRTLGEAQLGIYRQQLAAGLTGLSEAEYAAQWKANAAGVDLNRNFDAGWAQLDDGAAPASEGFKGAAPEDQPESRALAEYTRQLMPDATLSYHSSGSLIYADYAGAAAEVNAASRSLGLALGAAAGYPLAETESLDEGGFKDWAASALGIPSVTVELGYGDDPQRPAACAVVRQRNEEAPYVVADWLRQYGAG